MKFKSILFFLVIYGTLAAQDYSESKRVQHQFPDNFDGFGVALEVFENTALIGIPSDDDDINGENTQLSAGTVVAYEKNSNGVWEQKQILNSPERISFALFGSGIDINGNSCIIGAAHDWFLGQASTAQGAAYIFERNNFGVWEPVTRLNAADAGEKDYFGTNVAMAGNFVASAATGDTQDANGQNPLGVAGSVYLFKKDANGNWMQTQKIVPSDRAQNDFFGRSLRMTEQYLVVGAPRKDGPIEDLLGMGAVYIFEKDENDIWFEKQKLVPSDGEWFGNFGSSIAIEQDILIVGSNEKDEMVDGENLLNAGAAYVFKKNTLGEWIEIQKLLLNDIKGGDEFGQEVDISGDYAIFGTKTKGPGINSNEKFGTAYLFQKQENQMWEEVQTIFPEERIHQSNFGFRASIYGNEILVGAPGEGIGGAAYFFGSNTVNTTTPTDDYNWSIYPNPASEKLNIENKSQEALQINVLGIDGPRINTIFSSDQHVSVDISSLSSGLYFIQIVKGKKTEIKKLIKI